MSRDLIEQLRDAIQADTGAEPSHSVLMRSLDEVDTELRRLRAEVERLSAPPTVDSFNSPLRAGLCTAKREEGTPRTDTLIADGPFSGPKDWIQLWDKAIDSHRTLERSLIDLQGRLDDATGMLHGEHDCRMEAEAKLTERDELLREALAEIDRGPMLKPIQCSNCSGNKTPNSILSGFTLNWQNQAGVARCHNCGNTWQTIMPNAVAERIRRALSPESILEEWKGGGK